MAAAGASLNLAALKDLARRELVDLLDSVRVDC